MMESRKTDVSVPTKAAGGEGKSRNPPEFGQSRIRRSITRGQHSAEENGTAPAEGRRLRSMKGKTITRTNAAGHGSNAVSASPQFNRLRQCRHGMMLYNIHDAYIGRSLDQYGEFSEGEIDLFEQLIKPGQMILEVGANIGSHTVWLSQTVGPTGTVLAFEPQRIVYQTLCANLALNSITNVHCFCAAVGKAPGQIMVPSLDYSRANNFGGLGLGGYWEGESVPVVTIDDLNLPKCHFVKIDVEGMEHEVLEGAMRTIAALSPILYVENDRKEKSDSLIRFIDGLGYKMYYHAPPLFSPHNFAGNPVNVFGRIVSLNMLCLPKTVPQQMSGLQSVQVPAASALRKGSRPHRRLCVQTAGRSTGTTTAAAPG